MGTAQGLIWWLTLVGGFVGGARWGIGRERARRGGAR